MILLNNYPYKTTTNEEDVDMMPIESESQALKILKDQKRNEFEKENAVRFLLANPSELAMQTLIQSLMEDDFGVRWQASQALALLGKSALPCLLNALMDPEQVSEPRMRRGIYRVLKLIQEKKDPKLPVSVSRLIQALSGPAADITSMEEAYKVKCQLELLERDSRKKNKEEVNDPVNC
jgi:HEAT repeat protein